MKKLSLVIAFAFLGATASFAKSGISKSIIKTKAVAAVETSCTVTVQFGKSKVTITNSCTCTQTQACDGAYKIARLATML